jgi:hypothetical protein
MAPAYSSAIPAREAGADARPIALPNWKAALSRNGIAAVLALAAIGATTYGLAGDLQSTQSGVSSARQSSVAKTQWASSAARARYSGGSAGPTGDTGSSGPRGSTGSSGPQGNSGSAGLQ